METLRPLYWDEMASAATPDIAAPRLCPGNNKASRQVDVQVMFTTPSNENA